MPPFRHVSPDVLPRRPKRVGSRVFSSLIACALVAGSAASAQAATYTVENLNDSGPGSLRQAIVDANANPGADAITFTVSGTIVLASTLPPITDPAGLTIDGTGQSVVISGNGAVRVMVVTAGAVVEVRSLTIANGFVSTDSAPSALPQGGGGIQNNGTLTVTSSTFSGNTTAGPWGGGGIYNIWPNSLTVTNSTFVGNISRWGGGIVNEGTLTVANSTFSGNSVQGNFAGFGGGIYNEGGVVTLTNSTFSGNSAWSSGADIYNSPGWVTVTNTIFASSSISSPVGTCGGALFSNLLDGGYNISSDATCYFKAATSRSNTDPQLDPAGLQDNGGPTQTIALLPVSPAIDVIPAGTTVCGTAIATDQRGTARPQGPGCDIGAYEVEQAGGPVFTGFFAPVANEPTENFVKAGQAIPVKFSLGGDFGLNILAVGSPASQQVACTVSPDTSVITETVTAGASSLTYDAATQTYTYVWKTDKSWANTCRRLTLAFTDGSLGTRTAAFSFTK